MNRLLQEAFETAKSEVSKAGSFLPTYAVIEIINNLQGIVDAVDKSEGGGNADYTQEDVAWLVSLHDRGLTLGVAKTDNLNLLYTVFYNGEAVGAGTISDEGLEDTARDIKIMKLINAENILTMLEEN